MIPKRQNFGIIVLLLFTTLFLVVVSRFALSDKKTDDKGIDYGEKACMMR